MKYFLLFLPFLLAAAETHFDNLLFGRPGEADIVIDRPGFALGYVEYHKQPVWVIYRLTKEEVQNRRYKRAGQFRKDPAIPSGGAESAHYRRSGYDRGHLAPAADMQFARLPLKHSFYMSNISPQRSAFNRGIWKRLETLVRKFALTEGDLYVVTGPLLPQNKTVTIGGGGITVPAGYYKVVYDCTPPEKMIAFIIPNAGTKKPLQDFAVTVDTVEALTGLDFFPELDPVKERTMESSVTIGDWPW